jgi:hypothetical protein
MFKTIGNFFSSIYYNIVAFFAFRRIEKHIESVCEEKDCCDHVDKSIFTPEEPFVYQFTLTEDEPKKKAKKKTKKKAKKVTKKKAKKKAKKGPKNERTAKPTRKRKAKR